MTLRVESVRTTLLGARELHLLTQREESSILSAFEPTFAFSSSVHQAESLHAHIKVDAVTDLPHRQLEALGGRVENAKDGYIKYAFASGMNLIFSSIPVSEDDLRETPATRRARPFLDHLGVDVRHETEEAAAAFAAVPARAALLGFAHAAQGGAGKRVFCCHTSVGAKHWLFPKADDDGKPRAIEIAFGPLTVQPGTSGCDLRPSNPALGACASPACCPAPPITT
jgi:hypothetical protein